MALLYTVGMSFLHGTVIAQQFQMLNSTTIKVILPWEILDENANTVETVFYLIELAFGHKKLLFYAEMQLAFFMLFHPITFSLSQYYWGQMPLISLFDFCC